MGGPIDRVEASIERGEAVRKVIVIFMAGAVAACAVSPERFRADSQSLTASQVCHSRAVARSSNDPEFLQLTANEMSRRNLNFQDCARIIQREREMMAAAALVGLAAGAAASSGSGSPAQARDYSWDWDQFRDQYGRLVWRCRGIQTGQFANDSQCRGNSRIDDRWPG
jgi:hypothetical protein